MIIENIEDFSPCVNCQTKECGLVDGNECDRCNEFFKLKRAIERAEIVAHAYWILVEEGYKNRVKYYKCSHCGESVSVHTPVDKYCFNCGAKMDEGEKRDAKIH